MKKIFGLICMLVCGAASAADITIYYSPTCPHCHHAREFISNTLAYEYPDLKVTAVNVTLDGHRPEFMDTLKKCEYTSGGVPVMVVGEKCFQGYGDSMANDVRAAVEVGLSDAAKAAAAQNKTAMEKDADAFRAAHGERANVIIEKAEAPVEKEAQPQKKTKKSDSGWVFYAILIAMVLGLFFVLKGNKK